MNRLEQEARANPATRARPPVAVFATAPPVLTTPTGGLDVGVGGEVTNEVKVVGMVTFELEVGKMTGAEVVVFALEVVMGVRVDVVLVAGALLGYPDAEEMVRVTVAELLAAEPDTDEPDEMIWNGLEYWKVAGLESRLIMNP